MRRSGLFVGKGTWTCVALVALTAAGCGGAPAKEFVVPSSAMEPTLHCGGAPGCEADESDILRIQAYGGEPRRGDIVAFKSPPAAERVCGVGGDYVKRIIGLPGDEILFRAGGVYVNGDRLPEPWISPGREADADFGPVAVPSGSYFMAGDNRRLSCDSRLWGAVPRAGLIGRVVSIDRPGQGSLSPDEAVASGRDKPPPAPESLPDTALPLETSATPPVGDPAASADAGDATEEPSTTVVPSAPAPLPREAGPTKQGSRKALILHLQGVLDYLGYEVGTPDGVYGAKLRAAVRDLQRDEGLAATGVADTATLKALNSLLRDLATEQRTRWR